MTKRATLFTKIDLNLNKDFRAAIGMVKGYNRGSLREAVEEALRDWIRKKRKKRN